MDFELYLDGEWRPAGSIELADVGVTARRGAVELRYDADYALEHLGARDYRALTVHAPVALGVSNFARWPAFLIDLLPQGAARRRLERQAASALSEWTLLQRGATNPAGNIRVRPRDAARPQAHPGFQLQEMIARGDAFIEFATESGATVAGATDTQGEAPKFWVVEDDQGRWHPDHGNLDVPLRRHMLLKFPVPEAGRHAELILRHEAAYQKVAAALELRVTAPAPRFDGGALLIPRFDRRCIRGAEVRLGVESLYSVAGVLDSSATQLRHHDALIALSGVLTDFQTEVVEYVRRDLLNIALGNRDNHGRNTAVLKDTDGTMRLAPLYDLGPAFLDARAIARVMRWDGEEPGRTDWNLVLRNLEFRFEEAEVASVNWRAVAEAMQAFGRVLANLPALMAQQAVDAAIIEQREAEIARLARELDAIQVR
jgi:serine/threonine-protein kinase HipA